MDTAADRPRTRLWCAASRSPPHLRPEVELELALLLQLLAPHGPPLPPMQTRLSAEPSQRTRHGVSRDPQWPEQHDDARRHELHRHVLDMALGAEDADEQVQQQAPTDP